MPSTIDELLIKSQLDKSSCKTVRWGIPLETNSVGIYFVSTARERDTIGNLFNTAPIDNNILKFWIDKVPTIEIDGVKVSNSSELRKRLSSFWLPDENIIYIGQSESGLKKRVRQFYNTELGERRPHAGGHWIKTLSILKDMYVHYLPISNPRDHEEIILRHFIANVSDETRKIIRDPILPLPFANLELEKGNRKIHGIGKSKLEV